MFVGRVDVTVHLGNGNSQTLNLTLVGSADESTLAQEGLAALRRKRLLRITWEAFEQGTTLGYMDIAKLLFTSVSTLKRDVFLLESVGKIVNIKGRKPRRASVKQAVGV
jgi:hypothetical protein